MFLQSLLSFLRLRLQTLILWIELYTGLYPCGGINIFSCDLQDCSSNLTIQGGSIIWSNALQAIYDASGFSSNDTAPTSTTNTSNATSTMTAAPKSQNGMVRTTGISVGLGVPLLLAILALLALCLIRKRKNHTVSSDQSVESKFKPGQPRSNVFAESPAILQSTEQVPQKIPYAELPAGHGMEYRT